MTNRMKHLLAMYDANRGPIDKIASASIEKSNAYEKLCKQRITGRDFTRKWRTAEMSLGPDPYAARLIYHHVSRAAEELAPFAEQLKQPFEKDWLRDPYPRRARCKNMRNLPESLLDRLEPVFSQNALFDPTKYFQIRFDTWHEIYVRHLNEVDTRVKKGKGIQDRRYREYETVFSRHQPVLDKWFEKIMIAIGR